ncbi:MAG: aminotransferase class I/II-fold pyridoxal phosphate-dependent enzyme [Pseudomonadota bacterium]
MQFSNLTAGIRGAGVDAWDIHIRATRARARGEDVFVLSVGDPDFDTPALVVERAVQSLQDGDTHYAPVIGRDALRDAIAQRHTAHTDQPVGRDNVIVLAGAQNGLFATSLCLVQAGDEVIVLQPMYVTYTACIQATGATLVPVAMPPETGFRLDRAALAAAITPRTRAIYYASPCNPTGVVLDAEELRFIADLAKAHDLWVVADEVYRDVTFDAPHQSIAQFADMAERLVTIGSLSKSHAMTGWRAGWVVAPAPLIAHLGNLALCMLYGLPGFIQEAALVAIRDCDAASAQMRSAYAARRDLVARALGVVPGLHLVVPQASMFAFLDIRATGLASDEFVTRLYAETGVSLLDGAAFGACGAGHVRLSYACDESVLAPACQRIRTFVEALSLR